MLMLSEQDLMDKKKRFSHYDELLDKDFTGELLENPPVGQLHWVKIEEAKKLPMQEDIKIRFDLFFERGTFEIQTVWNEEKNEPEEVFIRKT